MPNDPSNRGYLSPRDLGLCERVLARLCAERGVDSNSPAAETLASDVLMSFQHGAIDEQALFDTVMAKVCPPKPKSAYEAMTDTRRAIRESQQLLDWLNTR